MWASKNTRSNFLQFNFIHLKWINKKITPDFLNITLGFFQTLFEVCNMFLMSSISTARFCFSKLIPYNKSSSLKSCSIIIELTRAMPIAK
uniref:Uncharacterized protein n=1 Tax=Anguilla anguilla TaxID=7936 RepID=A0A0E9X8Z0_ANGAN